MRPGGTLFSLSNTALSAAVITVTTADNASPPAGETSFLQALNEVADGDTIRFDIPGDGPHYIVTPDGGYPFITADDVTIDGYSQPGASPNSNSILEPNNASIGIVLDSRERGGRTVLDFPGFGASESAILPLIGAKNFTVRGLSFLLRFADAPDDGSDEDPNVYCVAFVQDSTGGKVQGCWFGLDPNGTDVYSGRSSVASFRGSINDADVFSSDMVIGTDGDGTDDRAEFNIHVGMGLAIHLQTPDVKVFGNFINVLPDGSFFGGLLADGSAVPDFDIEAIENGAPENMVIGTDGDGIGDDQERNIFGPVGYTSLVEFWRSGNNITFAGNYVNVSIDGFTTATSLASLVDIRKQSSITIGSNFDGVSDDLEGNRIYNLQASFIRFHGSNGDDGGADAARIAVRGNTLVNLFSNVLLENQNISIATYYNAVLVDPEFDSVTLVAADDTGENLIVAVPPAQKDVYPTAIVEFYVLDPAGYEQGFLHGKNQLLTVVDNSDDDLDPEPDRVMVPISRLAVLGAIDITAMVTYSQDAGAATTTTGRAVSGIFSDPWTVVRLPEGPESLGADRIVFETDTANLDNWEPFTGVVGNSVFLVEANSFADGSTESQRYRVAFQPVSGGEPRVSDSFFTDAGEPYIGPINASRQNGNPGRVAGDRRPGQVHFITGGEASPHAFAPFQSGDRWAGGIDRGADGRYATVQVFSLDTASLEQTPLTRAIDPVLGRLTSGMPGTTPEISRFGGEVAFLDDGNVVVVIDDRSNLIASERSATAVILQPDGTVVKKPWVIGPGQIWSNLATHAGGFCIRAGGVLYFFDNAGDLRGQIDQGEGMPERLDFDRGRGDGTRIGAHINSPYVFLAGTVVEQTEGGQSRDGVRIAAWDSRDQTFLGIANMSEMAADRLGSDAFDLAGDFERVNLAVDALNRIAVAYEANFSNQNIGLDQSQTLVRVLEFNAGEGGFNALTPSFFAFINNGPDDIRTIRPSVAMTTSEILVAAKGEINRENDPSLGATTLAQTTFYTVFEHPRMTRMTRIKPNDIIRAHPSDPWLKPRKHFPHAKTPRPNAPRQMVRFEQIERKTSFFISRRNLTCDPRIKN